MMKLSKVALVLVLSILGTWQSYAQYKVTKLGTHINSSFYDEISPVVSRDGNTLYFTRVASPDFCRTLIQDDIDISKTLTEAEYFNELKNIFSQISGKYIDDPFTSPINQEIMVASTSITPFDQVVQPGYPMNSALPNSVCSLAPDDRGLIIINHFYRDGSMQNGFSITHKSEQGVYSFPEPIFIQDFHTLSPEVNLTMARDGDVAILSLNRNNGLGESDLYVCFKLKDNLWSEPENMGSIINSPFRESTPYLSEDKTKLFFASNKPGGKGGTDIYVSRRLDYTWMRWSKPQLLVEPINSKFDDSHPAFVESTGNLYFTSRREGTSDIYSVAMEIVEKTESPIKIIGTIKNAITKQPVPNAYLYFDKVENNLSEKNILLKDGKFELIMEVKDVYRLSPKKNGFVGKNQLVDLNILAKSKITTYEIDFFIMPIGQDQKIEVNNIYFERGTATVLQSSYPEIDSLSIVLNQNLGLRIRIEGHTDSVGKDFELMDLSRRRAESIKKYLVLKRNVGSHRINTVGYGGLRPISPNNSDENRAKNRRVEIYVESIGANSKINYNDLPNPIVRYDHQEVMPKNDPTKKKEEVAITNKEVAKNKTSSSPKMDTPRPSAPTNNQNSFSNLTPFGKINFHDGTLAIEESSFSTIRKLVEFLNENPTRKISITGQTTTKDEKSNTPEYANQRARGVKEYLIFKSIPADRISILESNTNSTWCGVNILVNN